TTHYHAHKAVSQPELLSRGNLAHIPSAAESFNQLHCDYQALAGELRASALGLQCFTARVDHLEIADESGGIALGGEFSGAARISDGAILRERLVCEMVNASKAVFHFSEGDENLLAIFGDCFLICRFRAFVFRAISSTGKNRQRDGWPDRPD